MTANVVEDGLNDVRQHSKLIGHDRCCGPAKVMDAPVGEGLRFEIGVLTRLKQTLV